MAAYMAGVLRGQSHAEIIGPLADAGGENGLVLRGGEVGRGAGRHRARRQSRLIRLRTYVRDEDGASRGGATPSERRLVAAAHCPPSRRLALVGQRVDARRRAAERGGAAADGDTAAGAGAAALVLALLPPATREQLQPARLGTTVVVPRLLQGVLRRAARSSPPPQQRAQDTAGRRSTELRPRVSARSCVRRLPGARSGDPRVRSSRIKASGDLDARAAWRPRVRSRRGDGAVRHRVCELPPAADGKATGLAADRPTAERRLEIQAARAQCSLRLGCPDGIGLCGLRRARRVRSRVRPRRREDGHRHAAGSSGGRARTPKC